MELNCGLSQNIIDEINSVFLKFEKIESVILFGSRAKGSFNSGSDIDLAYVSNKLSFDEFLEIQIDLERLELIYKIDLIDYHKINEPLLKAHIDRVGVEFYKKQ